MTSEEDNSLIDLERRLARLGWTLEDLRREQERIRQGGLRCAEAFSSSPWHVQQAEKDPEFWSTFYASRATW